MKNRIVLMTVVGMALVLISQTKAWAYMGDGDEQGNQGYMARGMRGYGFANMCQDLNITQEQQEKFKTGQQISQEKSKQVREQLKAKNKELKDELQKADFNKDKVYALSSEIKGLSGQLLDLRISDLVCLRETLSPEQFNRLQQKKQQFQEKRQQFQQKNRKSKQGQWQNNKGEKNSYRQWPRHMYENQEKQE
ncbi:MAG: periplasmic heavy metal sensor [Candidatus Omnitrophica bacterium]|nr:periplasmic heavy metal sensor [Candidatus Omnitrophota bacterium]